MTVSTKLFADQMLNRFSQLNEAIELRQTNISTGRAITEASQAPIEAVKLSAKQERLTQLQGFSRNVGTAQARLSLGDTALEEVDNILVRLRELAISANNPQEDTAYGAMRVEVSQLREALVGLANTRTADGQALFGGYATDIVPFQHDEAGRVVYRGDGGEHTLAASDRVRLPTSVNGGAVFMQVQTPEGRESIFDIVDSLEAALLTAGQAQSALSARGAEGMSLRVNADRIPRTISFDLTGPASPRASGQGPAVPVRITVPDVIDGMHDAVVDAINAHTADTGVQASVTGGRIALRAETGEITLSALQIEGVTRASHDPAFTLSMDGAPERHMVPEVQGLQAQLAKVGAAGDDIAVSRTMVGARLARAEAQEQTLAARTLALEIEVAEMSSVDLEKVITELQTLLLTRDAARQAYAQIGQSSLFDYLK